MRIENNQRNRDILEKIFIDAPKTYEQFLLKGGIPPFPKKMTYKTMEKTDNFLNKIFEEHTNKDCICNENNRCLFERYKDKEVSYDQLFDIVLGI